MSSELYIYASYFTDRKPKGLSQGKNSKSLASSFGTAGLDRVILVDEQDKMIGIGEKLNVHLKGQLHRAFSVFIFDASGRLLIQKRAATKYHSGGLWSNTCCGHPRPGEEIRDAALRRLQEEMGIDCPIEKSVTFVYTVMVDNGLIEHEYDHVFIGTFDGIPSPDANEVQDWQWVEWDSLKEDMLQNQRKYTRWLSIAIKKFANEYGIVTKKPWEK